MIYCKGRRLSCWEFVPNRAAWRNDCDWFIDWGGCGILISWYSWNQVCPSCKIIINSVWSYFLGCIYDKVCSIGCVCCDCRRKKWVPCIKFVSKICCRSWCIDLRSRCSLIKCLRANWGDTSICPSLEYRIPNFYCLSYSLCGGSIFVIVSRCKVQFVNFVFFFSKWIVNGFRC